MYSNSHSNQLFIDLIIYLNIKNNRKDLKYQHRIPSDCQNFWYKRKYILETDGVLGRLSILTANLFPIMVPLIFGIYIQ